MSGLQVQIGPILLLLLMPSLPATPKPLIWQHGQIISLKEDAVDREGDVRTYVYSLRTKDSTYQVAFTAPLKAYLHTTVKFAVDQKAVYVEDLDGKQRKGCIMEPVQSPVGG